MPVLQWQGTQRGPREAAIRHPIVGMIRFSLVLSDGNFFPTMTDMPLAGRIERIFDTARMARRFDVFERFCLPSLRAQTDPGFNAILICSQLMPDMWKQRLERLLRNDHNIYARFFRLDANIQRVYKRALHEMVSHDSPVHASFRLDDDDALAPDFISQLRQRLMQEREGYALTFSRGFRLGPSEAGFTLETCDKPKLSAGLTYYSAHRNASIPKMQSVYNVGSHMKIDTYVPTEIEGGSVMFLQTSHGANVSMRKLRQGEPDLSSRDVLERIAGRFPWVDENALVALTGGAV